MAIHDDLQRGKSITQIHRETGVDRATIRKVKTGGYPEPGATTPPARRRPSLLDPYHEYIRERVRQGCFNTAVLYDELRAQGYGGSRTILKDFVRPLRPTAGDPEPVPRYETPPGQQAQCDWAKFGQLAYPDGTVRALWVFVYTLSYSRALFVEFVHDTRQDTLFLCLEHAFAAFGGVPARLLSDNMTPMVLAHPPGGPVQWHPRYAAFAAFHGFDPKAAPPYRGQTKGKVERPIRYLRDNFWPRVRRIEGLADLNRQVARWVGAVADLRIHGTTHERPADRRAADVAACTPYPAERRFWYGEAMERPVYPDGYIRWDGHCWAVGFAWIGQTVILQRRPSGGVVIRYGDQILREYPTPQYAHAVMGDPGPLPPSRTRTGPAAHSRGVHQVVAPEVEQRALTVYETVTQ